MSDDGINGAVAEREAAISILYHAGQYLAAQYDLETMTRDESLCNLGARARLLELADALAVEGGDASVLAGHPPIREDLP